MKKNMNTIGVSILIVLFILFYIITSFFLEKRNLSKVELSTDEIIDTNINNYEYHKDIVNGLYKEIKKIYDVVNNKYIVDQEDTISIGDLVYKKITNFNEVTNIFTSNGLNKYLNTLSNYFAYTDDGYYLAGNLVTYQTYYFRGDDTNIYILDGSDNEINAIIYERWTNANKNTLATIKVIKVDNNWLVDNIEILSTE